MVSNMLLVLTIFTLLALAFNLALNPVIIDMDSKAALLPKEDPNSQEAMVTMTGLLDNLQQHSGLQLAFMVPFFIISSYSLVSTVHSSATMYHDKFLTLGS
ncbi:hypothetical protein QJS04_geneDACA003939 [Acorus gramineus]|uniref:Uncharacterized protein n=1 Tax=Acorus gramineus TaxID=55184 RepID=A0AAV9BDU0_ACOGR|nr:hypothetical protein QJS04_geneDACA003939 [Acorus gramineus]